MTEWAKVSALDRLHVWTEAAVREKFDWGTPAGVHVLVLRVFRLHEPIAVLPSPALAGCKSWIELPYDFDAHPASPCLCDRDFVARLNESGL